MGLFETIYKDIKKYTGVIFFFLVIWFLFFTLSVYNYRCEGKYFLLVLSVLDWFCIFLFTSVAFTRRSMIALYFSLIAFALSFLFILDYLENSTG